MYRRYPNRLTRIQSVNRLAMIGQRCPHSRHEPKIVLNSDSKSKKSKPSKNFCSWLFLVTQLPKKEFYTIAGEIPTRFPHSGFLTSEIRGGFCFCKPQRDFSSHAATLLPSGTTRCKMLDLHRSLSNSYVQVALAPKSGVQRRRRF